jgi:hypothetical protein
MSSIERIGKIRLLLILAFPSTFVYIMVHFGFERSIYLILIGGAIPAILMHFVLNARNAGL